MVRPWLYLPPEVSQVLGFAFLKTAKRWRTPHIPAWNSFEWKHLHFKNRLGIAGGVDKNADLIEAFWCWGPGFIEIGTVTPQPQGKNPGRVLRKDVSAQAVWNRLGFPSHGVDEVVEKLKNLPIKRQTPVFANLGKNRTTANEDAAQDYIHCMQKLNGLADVFVVNISSPNTSGLRDLQQASGLEKFLKPIVDANQKTKGYQSRDRAPLLLKLSPDMNEVEFKMALDVSHSLGIDGWILTNTTLSREQGSPFPSEGGVSGKPLQKLSLRALDTAVSHLGKRRDGRLLISCGGVMQPEEVSMRLDRGADLVQVYTALIFHGPQFFIEVAKNQMRKEDA